MLVIAHRIFVYLLLFLALGVGAWSKKNNQAEVSSIMDGVATKLEQKAEVLNASGNTDAGAVVALTAQAVSESKVVSDTAAQ